MKLQATKSFVWRMTDYKKIWSCISIISELFEPFEDATFINPTRQGYRHLTNPEEIRPFTPCKILYLYGWHILSASTAAHNNIYHFPSFNIHLLLNDFLSYLRNSLWRLFNKRQTVSSIFCVKFSSSKTPTPYINEVSFEKKSQTSSFVVTYNTRRRYSFWFP
jgi:hypothetical protein